MCEWVLLGHYGGWEELGRKREYLHRVQCAVLTYKAKIIQAKYINTSLFRVHDSLTIREVWINVHFSNSVSSHAIFRLKTCVWEMPLAFVV